MSQGWLIIAVLLVLTASPAAAQQRYASPPPPPETPVAVPADKATTPPPAKEPAVTPSAAPEVKATQPSTWRRTGASKAAVTSEALPGMTPGLWAPEEYGFTATMWQGLDYRQWTSLLSQVPARITSPLLRGTLSASVLSRAEPPAAVPGASPADTHAMRARAALAALRPDDWAVLKQAIPETERSALFDETAMSLSFATYGASMCPQSPAQTLAPYPGWHLYCLLATGQKRDAQLQVDLMRETGSQMTDVMTTASAIATDTIPTIPITGSALLVRMLALAPDLPAQDMADYVAANTRASLAERAAHFVALEQKPGAAADAEWLADHGFIPLETLQAVYESAPFSEEQRAGGEIIANRLSGGLQRAFLWQLLQKAGNDDDRVRLINNFVTSGGANSLVGVRGQILTPLLTSIGATPSNAWAAPVFFAIAAAQGNPTAATGWYKAAESTAQGMSDAQSWLLQMWPVAVVTGDTEASSDALRNWVTSATTAPTEESLPVADILALLEARGMAVTDDIWTLAGGRPVASETDAATMEPLLAAASAGRQGETILRTLVLAGDRWPKQPATTAATIINAWHTVSMNERADALLIEALLYRLYPARGDHAATAPAETPEPAPVQTPPVAPLPSTPLEKAAEPAAT